ncbi:MAG: limonene-1,2-epoxide hydrolase family protein [Pseudomonadales bacterium]
MSSNTDIIREFVADWSKLDAVLLASYFASDGCYYNMPTQPVRGRANVQEFIANFLASWTETHWDILNIAEKDDIVYCERLDRTKTSNGDVDLPCFGVFVMENGKIKEWRDYFDLGTFMKAMQPQ